ncbi:MAG: DUF2298 domain-containing protein, partial [Proteobacteria bacterium]|nr:DUF2298 domain-containing protein [Pseudomonadota bacterium]
MATFIHGCMGRLGLSPWSPATMGCLLGLAFLAWLIWFVRCRNSLVPWLRQNLSLLFGLEAAFLVVFLLGLWLVAHNPGLLGTEKLMDFGILKSVLRADIFPPIDPWFAGEPLNYYWFGHHSTALLCKIASIPPRVGYNLLLAFLLATVFQASCGLFLSGLMRLSNTLLGASMITLAGNITPVWDLVTEHGNVLFVPWKATRIIPHTITEFPFFSFLIGDLHAHFLMLPAFTLFLVSLFPCSSDRGEGAVAWIRVGVLNLLFSVAVLGNTWNIPVLGLIFVVFKIGSVTKLPWWSLLPSIVFWPLLFEVQGNPLILAWVSAEQTSPIGPFLLMWGMPFALLTVYLLYKEDTLRLIQSRWYYFLCCVPFAFHSLPASIAIILAIILWLTAGKGGGKTWHAIAICGLIVVVVPECIYLNDSYTSPNERLNTVFKMHYAAWILLMSASAYAAMRLNTTLQKVSPRSGPILMSLWLMSIFVYPVL